MVASAGPGGGAGQSVFGLTRSSDDSESLAGDPLTSPGINQPVMSSWARFVTGVEQAFETLRNEADARLRQEQEPVKSDGHGTNVPDQDDGQEQIDVASSTQQSESGGGGPVKAEPNRLEVIDSAIGTFEKAEPPPLRLLIPSEPVQPATASPNPVVSFAGIKDRTKLPRCTDEDHSQLAEIHASRTAALAAISATAVTAEMLLRRSGLSHGRRFVSRIRIRSRRETV